MVVQKIRIPIPIRISVSLLAGFFITLASCGERPFFEENAPIDDAAWKIRDKKTFTVLAEDTTSLYDFYIDLRHGKSYPFENIYFFMKTTLPGNKTAIDTIGYYMKGPGNEWLGNKSGSLISHHVLVKPRMRFPRKGKYTFTLQHGMYPDPLADVNDIGITISEHKRKE